MSIIWPKKVGGRREREVDGDEGPLMEGIMEAVCVGNAGRAGHSDWDHWIILLFSFAYDVVMTNGMQ